MFFGADFKNTKLNVARYFEKYYTAKRMSEDYQKIYISKYTEKKMFKDKTLLITGGTGSFGNAVLKRFLDSDIKEVRIFPVMKRSKTICAIAFKIRR